MLPRWWSTPEEGSTYLALAEAGKPHLRGPEQVAWLERLEEEHDNMRAAMRWFLSRGEAERGLRLAAALGPFWQGRGHLTEGRERIADLLALGEPGSQAPSAARGTALDTAGLLAAQQGDLDSARSGHEAALTVLRQAGDQQLIVYAFNNLASVVRRQGDADRASRMYEQNLTLFRQLEDPWGIGASLANMGELARISGDYDRARALLQESLVALRGVGHQRGIASAVAGLGRVATDQGDYAEARLQFDQSLALSRTIGDRRASAVTLCELGVVALAQGAASTAQTLFEESAAIAREIGNTETLERSLELLASVRQLGAAERADTDA